MVSTLFCDSLRRSTRRHNYHLSNQALSQLSHLNPTKINYRDEQDRTIPVTMGLVLEEFCRSANFVQALFSVPEFPVISKRAKMRSATFKSNVTHLEMNIASSLSRGIKESKQL